jgi:predicted DNA-binding mobile mystery protein A
MTLEQLGGKLNITRQGVRYIEESESSGSISLNSLRDVGIAMDMKLVYGFVPIDGSIDSLITRKSRILAEKIVLRTNHNMLLEDQQIGEEKLKLAIDELASEIKTELRKTIWD